MAGERHPKTDTRIALSNSVMCATTARIIKLLDVNSRVCFGMSVFTPNPPCPRFYPTPMYKVFRVYSTDRGLPDFHRIVHESGWIDTLEDAIDQGLAMIEAALHGSDWWQNLTEEKLHYMQDELKQTRRFPVTPETPYDETVPEAWQIVILGYYH